MAPGEVPQTQDAGDDRSRLAKPRGYTSAGAELYSVQHLLASELEEGRAETKRRDGTFHIALRWTSDLVHAMPDPLRHHCALCYTRLADDEHSFDCCCCCVGSVRVFIPTSAAGTERLETFATALGATSIEPGPLGV